METQTLAKLATEVLDQFSWDKRDDGTLYWSRKDLEHDDWISTLCHDAHGDMFPDDWRYSFIHDALSSISEGGERTVEDWEEDSHEAIDGAVDVYNSKLCDWLGSHGHRAGYVDEAVEELGHSESAMQDLMLGQYVERAEVFASVLHSLSERLDELEA